MRFIHALSITAISLAACATDELEPAGEEVDEPVPEVSATALCFAQPTPPSPNFTHNFNADHTAGPITILDTGTECDGYNTRWIGTGKVTFRVVSPTTDPEACVNTVLTLINWQWQGNAWGRYTSTTHGEYTAAGCVLPAAERNVATNYHFEIRASRKTCATTPLGELCGTTWGLPVRISGTYCNPENGGCLF